jgi:hypothetical protein
MFRQFAARVFQRSSAVRFLLIPAAFALFALVATLLVALTHRKPTIDSVSPSIASPGEIIVIEGKRFGDSKAHGWVEIAGDRISQNACIRWTDGVVMVVLPVTVGNGLVYVSNKNGKSNPCVFANRDNIPVAARVDYDTGLPIISELSETQAATGQPLTIRGKNFGITKGDSEVRFSWQTVTGIPVAASSDSTASIPCSERDFDYESWSDQELRVRVPDGATSGIVFVKTDRGASNHMQITVANEAGTKRYARKRTYLLSLGVDVTDVSASDGNMLFLRVPLPERYALQQNVEITASEPKPYMDDYKGTILHQIENLKTGKTEKVYHSFLVTNYSVETSVKPSLVKPWADAGSPLYLMYTAPDPIVPSGDPSVASAAKAIVKEEKNPYLGSRLIYDWLVANMTWKKIDDPNRTALVSLAQKTGDSYDFAILFASLARASGIPALPVAGLLVDGELGSRVHWWAEFYVEKFGWIPVDPGLAAETREFDAHFGKLGVDHVAFSRGWVEQRAMTQKSRIVHRTRSYAFQPIWEESGGNIKGYASFWSDPKVLGIY